jgi:hypothetical protein
VTIGKDHRRPIAVEAKLIVSPIPNRRMSNDATLNVAIRQSNWAKKYRPPLTIFVPGNERQHGVRIHVRALDCVGKIMLLRTRHLEKLLRSGRWTEG